MKIQELKINVERDDIKRPYQTPLTSVMAMDYLEGVLSMTSWDDGHGGLDGVEEGDPEGKGAKAFNFQFQDMWADDTKEDDEEL